MANQRNQNTLAALKETLEGVETFYLVNYQGLSAGQLSQLRAQIAEKGGRMIVAKNTLIHLALQDMGQDYSASLTGPSALVTAGDDPAGVAKMLADFAKTNEAGIPEAKAGFVEGQPVDVAVVKRLASLGSKDQLQAEFVGVLSSHMSNFVGILDAYKTKLEESA